MLVLPIRGDLRKQQHPEGETNINVGLTRCGRRKRRKEKRAAGHRRDK